MGIHKVTENLRVILIGGSSNVGKSTVSQSLAGKLGWQYRSTDYLARHPGRPWKTKQKTVPEHVAEHYASLEIDELLTDVLQHYKRLGPMIENIITSHATDPSTDPLILEGSALWPEFVTPLAHKNVAALWLTAEDDLFQERIYASSQYKTLSSQEKFLVQKFLGRTILYNQRMMDTIAELGLMSLEVGETDSLDEVSDRVLECLAFRMK
jgi:2-phosphoglycerate kinase